ncbi:hypothetical protein OKW24_005284 [Peribacillus simplex]|nr:hypothetical protein [Peribacillus simplex]
MTRFIISAANGIPTLSKTAINELCTTHAFLHGINAAKTTIIRCCLTIGVQFTPAALFLMELTEKLGTNKSGFGNDVFLGYLVRNL